jgi:hypothetical protein
MPCVGICARDTGIALFLSLCGGLPVLGARAESPSAPVQDATDLEEIVVTGSHIHGADAAGSKLIVIGREQIDASGYGRI